MTTALCRRHLGAHALPEHHTLDIPRPVHIEHHDGHAVIHAQRNGRRVHHLQVLAQHLAVRNRRKKFRIWNLFRIGVVNSVHARGFQDHVRLDFHRAQRRRGVRREIRIPRPRRKNHHAVFFQVPDRAPPDERLGNLFHLDGAQHAREHAFFFQRILKRQRIDDRREHAHVIAGGSVDLESLLSGPAENISAADHDRRLHSKFVYIFQFTRDSLNRLSVDAESLRPLKRLSGKFQQDPPVCRLVFFHAFLTSFLRRGHESPFARSKITGIVTNYLHPRTLRLRQPCPRAAKKGSSLSTTI